MKCPQCHGTEHYKNGHDKTTGKQQYRCKSCGKTFNANTAYYGDDEKKSYGENNKPVKMKIGMTINEFRQKHDVDYIVQQTLKKLEKDIIYEKNDVIKLTNLRPGYPGLSAALEAATQYRGRAGGISYWGHPETILELKHEATMT